VTGIKGRCFEYKCLGYRRTLSRRRFSINGLPMRGMVACDHEELMIQVKRASKLYYAT
jgi:hypothetical protein